MEERRVDGLVTDLMSLPYLWMGKPVQVKPLTISVFDAKKLHPKQTFVASRMEIIFNKSRVNVVQFQLKRTTSADANLLLWIREADGVPLRVELGLAEKYGVSAVMGCLRCPIPKVDHSIVSERRRRTQFDGRLLQPINRQLSQGSGKPDYLNY